MTLSAESPLGGSRSFNPALLDRTVIAIPLLEHMQEEITMIEWALKSHPEWFESFNCAIILNPNYPGGVEVAYAAADKLIEQARQRFSDSHETTRLGELQEAEGYCFTVTSMNSKLRRKILALNADLAERPIKRVLPTLYDVVIDLNLNYCQGRERAQEWIKDSIPIAIQAVLGDKGDEEQKVRAKTVYSRQYVFARLEARVLMKLVELDMTNAHVLAGPPQEVSETTARKSKKSKPLAAVSSGSDGHQETVSSKYRAIHHIWPDFRISSCITRSVATVKADAALSSFAASGKAITWAVMDSGIHADHPHFKLHGNIDPNSDLHCDFTETDPVPEGKNGALVDVFGHGTHVAGIIAGEQRADGAGASPQTMNAVTRTIESFEAGHPGRVATQSVQLSKIRGMAPHCQLVSLKVLDEDGQGEVSSLIAAIYHIQEMNSYGRNLRIHGVNMSLGYEFEAEWFACGQSPLCVEVNRLVRSGVVVVVAAGNTGYGTLNANERRGTSAGMALTINDPGNADLAITVGSTHRDMPHVYGVSFFSSKGPSGDGRLKPDVVAPGEKILSCATGKFMLERGKKDPSGTSLPCDYVEQSGTSMAAPHVSGIVASFLSVRREFIGEPEKIKQIFVSTCTDLQRERTFQGAGLVDLMRAIQSV